MAGILSRGGWGQALNMYFVVTESTGRVYPQITQITQIMQGKIAESRREVSVVRRGNEAMSLFRTIRRTERLFLSLPLNL